MESEDQVTPDSDIFALWAAEELVAAGRATCPSQRQAHRRQGEFLADICHGLRQDPSSREQETSPLNNDIGAVLARAFATPTSTGHAAPDQHSKR
jgi:hypothetical protein